MWGWMESLSPVTKVSSYRPLALLPDTIDLLWLLQTLLQRQDIVCSSERSPRY